MSFKKSKKQLMTSFFRSRSWSRTLPISVSKPKLRSRPVLVSEKFYGLGLGRVGLDYSPENYRGTSSKRLFICSIFFDVLSVFCNHQPHTRSKPIDGIIDYRLGQCFPLLKNGFFQFYGVFKSSSAVNILLQMQ